MIFAHLSGTLYTRSPLFLYRCGRLGFLFVYLLIGLSPSDRCVHTLRCVAKRPFFSSQCHIRHVSSFSEFLGIPIKRVFTDIREIMRSFSRNRRVPGNDSRPPSRCFISLALLATWSHESANLALRDEVRVAPALRPPVLCLYNRILQQNTRSPNRPVVGE